MHMYTKESKNNIANNERSHSSTHIYNSSKLLQCSMQTSGHNYGSEDSNKAKEKKKRPEEGKGKGMGKDFVMMLILIFQPREVWQAS